MRRLLVAGFMVFAAAHAAQSADPAGLPVLRGSFYEAPKTYRTVWQGFYLGGQAGYGVSTTNFDGYNVTSLVPPSWPALGAISHRAPSYGGFVGYNAQFEDVIVGVEGSALHGTFDALAENNRISVSAATGVTTAMQSVGSMKLKDYGSLRLRGGYVAGSFLPYMFVGLGLGRADTTDIKYIEGFYTLTNLRHGTPTRITVETNNQLVAGFTAGAGLDWMVFGSLFARAEYEYMQLSTTLNTNVHTVRGGVGYKF